MASTPIPGRAVRGSTTGRPIMALFDLVGRRWALRIVWELREGDATFRDLAHRCDDTAAGIVERGDGGYRLTADGRELMELLRPLGQWSQRWADRA
jgi:DNA-binding HxlR family transcriptional regulator